MIFALIIVSLVTLTSSEEAGSARYLGSYSWDMDKTWFGGWSGIEMSPDGQNMWVLSDRGRILSAEIIRNGDRITGIKPTGMQRLKSSRGAALTHRIADSEGLAIAPDGSIFISFENVTRVARYASPTAKAQVLRKYKAFRPLARNKALEALAIDPDGRLFALPEKVDPDGTIRVFVLDDNIWSTPITLTGDADFLPVGADFGPDGRFYLLERAWRVWGFRTRVRRWEITDDVATNEKLLVETGFGTHDNLEGLSVWRDQQGNIRLTMIADDNFLVLQNTEIAEYIVEYTVQE